MTLCRHRIFSPNISTGPKHHVIFLLKMIVLKYFKKNIGLERHVDGRGAIKMFLKRFKVEKRHGGALKKPIIFK